MWLLMGKLHPTTISEESKLAVYTEPANAERTITSAITSIYSTAAHIHSLSDGQAHVCMRQYSDHQGANNGAAALKIVVHSVTE